MRRRLTVLSLTAALSSGLVSCGDPGRVTVSDAPRTGATGDPASTEPLTPAAAAFVDEVRATYGLTPACTIDEAAHTIESLPDQEAAVNDRNDARVVAAYLSRTCSPCFAIGMFDRGLTYDSTDLGDRDPDVNTELIGASLPSSFVEPALHNELRTDRGPVADYWKANCRDWQVDVRARLQADRAAMTTTTMRPPDGPNEQSYGDDEPASIVSRPEAGPPPKVVWSLLLEPEAMILHDGVVYVADIGAGVTALDAATGEVRWDALPEEDADSSGGVTMSIVDGALRVFVPWSHAVELDAATGEVRSIERAQEDTPWPEQAGHGDEDGYAYLEGWEPRVTTDEDDGSMVGHTADGAIAFETKGEALMGGLPYALRSGSTVVVADQVGYVVGLDWP